MSDPLDFLKAESPQADEPVDNQSDAAPAPGEDGASAPDAKAATDAPAAPAPVAPPEPGHVPISAMLDEREKRQALERQLAAIQEQQRAAALANAAPIPIEEQVEARLYAANLNASRRFAEREYGKDVIKTVHEWAVDRCNADPLFNQQMRSSEDPYEAAMQAYNREQVLAEVKPDELAAFKAWKAAQAQAGQVSTQSHPSSPAVALPRSLANAPGNGASGSAAVPVGEGNAYAGLFK